METQKFDTLNIILPKESFIETCKHNYITTIKSDVNGEIRKHYNQLEPSYIEKTNPFGINSIALHFNRQNLSISLSAKILHENYSKGISKETIGEVFYRISEVGFEIDKDLALNFGKVRRADPFNDIEIDSDVSQLMSEIQYWGRKDNSYIKKHIGSVEFYNNSKDLRLTCYSKYKELTYLQPKTPLSKEKEEEYFKNKKKARKQKGFLQIIDLDHYINMFRVEGNLKSQSSIKSILNSKSETVYLKELLYTEVNLLDKIFKNIFIAHEIIDLMKIRKSKMTYSMVVEEFGWLNLLAYNLYDYDMILEDFKRRGVKLGSREHKIIREKISYYINRDKPEVLETMKNIRSLIRI